MTQNKYFVAYCDHCKQRTQQFDNTTFLLCLVCETKNDLTNVTIGSTESNDEISKIIPEDTEEYANALDQLSYWVRRCLAAEKYIHWVFTKDEYGEENRAREKWQELKNKLNSERSVASKET